MKAQGEFKKATSRPTGQRRLLSAVLRDTKDFAYLREECDGLYEA